MSEWNDFNPKKDDISFSDDKKEMHINFESNYNGNVYLKIDIKDIILAIKKNNIDIKLHEDTNSL